MAVVEVVEAPAVAAVAAAAAVAGPAYSVLRCSPFTPTSVSLRFPPFLPLPSVSFSLPFAVRTSETASLYHRALTLLSLFLSSRSSRAYLSVSSSFSRSHARALPLVLRPSPSLLFRHTRFVSLVPRLRPAPPPFVRHPRPPPTPIALPFRPLSPHLSSSSFVRLSFFSSFIFVFFFLRLSSSRSQPRIADERFDGANRSPAIDGKSWHAPQRSIEIDRS